MVFFAYILRCSDGSYYAGHTDNLEHRIAQHTAGGVEGYTQGRRPVTLMWSQNFPSRLEAREAERQIKGWTRRKKEALIRGDWADLHDAAIPPSERALRFRSGRTEVVENSPMSVRAERSRSTSPTPTPPPAIILVRPQLGENIGKAARAMLNFGLTEMRLVAPRDGWPNPAAGPAASGADSVLANAKVYDTVADAVADCAHVYATTVRKRGVTKPVVTPEAAAQAIHAGPGRSAILFGPERSGLETDDVAVARTILTVPINPEFGSLNLAQAVILVAYEWSKGEALASPPEVELPQPAPQEELDGMIAQLDAMLDRAGYFFPPDRIPATKRTLRTLLTKPAWSSQEVRTLRGVLSALTGKTPRERN
ncbi:TrmH family RNA methyltransferase [Sphingomonas sp.]|jgi:tRNA/rRNA methyltransferase|uniref:TrmH family RNA methyltransferase n=1 Tax=Sphingomonas sp. TaxID=28214 RepID=UPI0035C8614E